LRASPGLRPLRAADFAGDGPVSAEERQTASEFVVVSVLIFALPMFAQSVHYMNEIVPFYYFSKAWPLAVLPLTIYGLATLKLPGQAIYAVLLAYVAGLTPLLSMIHLGNGLIDAIATTVKVWPFSYYIALSAFLAWLMPAPQLLRRVIIGWGSVTMVLLVLLWVFVPSSWYTTDPSQGKLFMYEIERGYRIYMPMFFGTLLIFYLTRRALDLREWWAGAAAILCVALLILIFKQRAAIAAVVLVMAIATFTSVPEQVRHLGIAALALLLAIAVVIIAGPMAQSIAEGLGGSLWLRLESLQKAIYYLGDNPIRWIFGVGGTTRFGTVTMADIFGTDQFYLADIGWAGIVFEYGLLGAGLIAATYVASFLITYRIAVR